jgi:membrane associated rhomboid family serine protease
MHGIILETILIDYYYTYMIDYNQEQHEVSLRKERNLLYTSFSITFIFVLFIWIIWALDSLFMLNLVKYGVHPRTIIGLRGILFMPYLHGSFQHILSNTIPALILGTVLFNIYPRVALKTIILIQIFSGITVWLIGATNSFHIGASGVIFGIASFLFFSGFFRKDRQSVAISFFVGMLYGGSMIAGMLPIELGISWEGHLSGAIGGFICALLFKNIDLPKPEIEMLEDSDMDDKPFFEKEDYDKLS